MNTKQTEALEFYDQQGIGRIPGDKAIQTIREALAEQPAKCKHNVFAPYRCTQCEAEQPRIDYRAECWPESPHYKPAPAPGVREQPVQQVDELTVWKARATQAEAAIAKFMEQTAQQQEPVAWVPITEWRWNNDAGTWEGLTDTSPQPSKPWVGLTYEEVKELIEFEDYENDPQGFIEFVEAKLREKNA